MLRWAVDLDCPDRGQVLRRTAAAPRRRSGGDAAANGPSALARGPGPAGVAVQNADARGMVRAARRHRRLLRPGAHDRRGDAAPAQRRATNLRRDRWDRTAGAGAAVQPYG